MNDCPPLLEPIQKIVSTEGGETRRLVHKASTRTVIVTDQNARSDTHWGSVGLLTVKNRRDVTARIRYRRAVPMPQPLDAGIIGWTDHCWEDGVLTLTCEIVLEPGELTYLDLYAFVLYE